MGSAKGRVRSSRRSSLVVLSLALLGPPAAEALEVALTVANREATAQSSAAVTSGVPFARGRLRPGDPVRLLCEGSEVPLQVLPTALWPDGSVRWLLLDFQLDLPPAGEVPLRLETGVAPGPVAGVTVSSDTATLTVSTGTVTFSFDKAELEVAGNRFEVTAEGSAYTARPFDVSSWVIEESGPLKVVVRVEGGFFDGGGTLLRDELVRWRARLVFLRNHSAVRMSLTFRNNNAYWHGSTQPDLVLEGASCGVPLLSGGDSYVFGSGVERTWEVEVTTAGTATLRETRFAADGSVAVGYQAPRPLAVVAPAYVASTRAWGCLAQPVSGLPPDRQEDFDRFEKLQRAKVLAADVEDPPGLTGITIWQHLEQDLGSWHDYGDLRWGGDTGSLSGNHYDWSLGMYLHFLRTGTLAFADAARVLASHEIDLDIYHTGADNYQKNWESRPSHDNPGNDFGEGRPSHTWAQGYALHWLLTGDRRGLDAVEELSEGIRQYMYESFNGEGYVSTSEIRIHGWLAENLLVRWRLDPTATFATTSYGTKTTAQAIRDLLQAVLDREEAAGGQGFVYFGDEPPDPDLRQPLQHLYFVEPAIKVYEEVLAEEDPAYAEQLLGLVQRLTAWLISETYGGDFDGGGLYRPLQIPYIVDIRLPQQTEGQLPYLLMAGNAAAFCYSTTGDESYRSYARAAFSDYVRYFGVTGGDSWVDPDLRTPTAYNSAIYVDTESKIQGWSNRYGQYLLAMEQLGPAAREPRRPSGRVGP